MFDTNKVLNMQMRDAFISKLYERAKIDKDIIFVSNDYGAPSLDRFREDFPNQYINAGISEQNIISVAAGLAISGKKVFVYSIASFIVLRCLEQIKLDICLHNLPVTIIAVGTCYTYSEDGPTHHATEDISIMRSMEGMEILSPSNSLMTSDFVDLALESNSPTYIRLDKGVYSDYLKNQDQTYNKGFNTTLPENDLIILSTGTTLNLAFELSDGLSDLNISSSIIDLYRLKPLNKKLLNKIFKKASYIITIEEHTINGGLGSIIAENLLDHNLNSNLKRFGVNEGNLYNYGVRDQIREKVGLDSKTLLSSTLSWIDNRKR